MTTSQAAFNGKLDENGESVADAGNSVQLVCEAPATSTPADDPPTAMVRRALEMLEAVEKLLHALSPLEIEAMAERAHLGRLGDAHVGYWRIYCARHKVLSDVFSMQRSTFAQRAAAHFERSAAPQREDES